MVEADSTALATPIPASLKVTALAELFGVAHTTIQRRLKKGWVPPKTAQAVRLIWSPVTDRPVQAHLKLALARPPNQVRRSRAPRPIQHYRLSAAIYP
jgi:hypothetical protein